MPPQLRKKQKHRKSKLGCLNCRQRRIKCGEELDSCYNCLDRNLRCTFLDLTPAEKQLIIDQHKDDVPVSKTQFLDNNDKELKLLSNDAGLFFSVEKVLLGSPAAVNSEVKGVVGLFGQLDFDYTSTETSPELDFGKEARGSRLPGSELVSVQFSVQKISRKRYSELFDKCYICSCCGEDDVRIGFFKNEMMYWYLDMNIEGCRSELLYYTMILRAAQLVAQALRKDTPAQLKRAMLEYKLKGLQLAQGVIADLNRPSFNTDAIKLYRALKNLAYYLSVTFASTFFAEESPLVSATFMDGFILTGTLGMFKKTIENYSTKLPPQLALRDDMVFTLKLLGWIGMFHARNINFIFIPNYNLAPLVELRAQLTHLILALESSNWSCRPLSLKHARDLIGVIDRGVLQNRPFLENYDDEAVCTFSPQYMFDLLKIFYGNQPSEMVWMDGKMDRMTPAETLIYMFWYGAGVILDNIFPEALYLFLSKFSGMLNFSGYGTGLLNRLRWKLANIADPAAKEFLTRTMAYISRTTSFLSYRMTLYWRNLRVFDIFPSNPAIGDFECIRYDSRKVHLQEIQIPYFAKSPILKENYPITQRPLTPNPGDRYAGIRPNRKENYLYCDIGFDINVNVDENYEKVQEAFAACGYDLSRLPIEYMDFNEFGLIKNIDYRPNLNNYTENFFGNSSTKEVEHNLSNYLPDRQKLLQIKIEKWGPSKLDLAVRFH